MRTNPKTLRYIFGASILALSMGACSDSLERPGSINSNSADNTLTIYLPNVAGAFEYGRTRADGEGPEENTAEALASEASIDNLYLVMVDDKDNSNVKVFDLTELNDSESVATNTSSDITPYSLKFDKDEGFVPGDYKLYVLANLDKYLGENDVTDLNTLTQIQEAVLDFESVARDKPIIPGELPMACLALRDGSWSAEASETHSLSGGNKELYADMTFLCSKVRYTILFDQETFSEDFDGSVIDFEQAPVAENVRTSTRLFYDATKDNDEADFLDDLEISLLKVEYPKEGENYPDSAFDNETGMAAPDLEPTDSWRGNTRAWQGTVYLPENLLEGDDNATSLTFTGIVDKDKSFEKEETFPSILLKGDEKIKRGHFVDLCAKIISYDEAPKLALTVNVADWTLKDIKNQLHGPYELIVEKTELEVKSGSWSEPFWYISDVDIDFDFPKIPVKTGPDDTDIEMIEFYKAETFEADGKKLIRLQVNPEIPYIGVLEGFKDESSSYSDPTPGSTKTYNIDDVNYFHIVAGSLRKEIKVYPLQLEPILEVSPVEIIIDVRELINSGHNTGVIDINYETNITEKPIKVTITSADDTDLIQDLPQQPLTLCKGEEIFSGDELNDQIGTLLLKYDQLFGGIDYWTKEHSYTITFDIEEVEGITSQTVTVTVKPRNTDYIIHFKCDNLLHEWENPHVYIYQCLELPADLPDGDGIHEYAGKTVGYFEYNTSNPSAALEFLFSNNISFKGWHNYGGLIDPYGGGTIYENSGFVFVGGWQPRASSFNPSQGDTDYYNYDINLNSVHQENQDSWLCPYCKKYAKAGDFNKEFHDNDFPTIAGEHLFAGVAMEPEKDRSGKPTGWYKYTLSGIATPGKCLIIFFDGHVWNDLDTSSTATTDTRLEQEKYRRYPTKENGNDTAGVPLFDYPNNEGWFLYDGFGLNRNQNFVDALPEEKTYDPTYCIRGEFNNWLNGIDDWDTTRPYQFYKEGPNRWRTNTLEISNKSNGFRIGDKGWSVHLGPANNNNRVTIGVKYKLNEEPSNNNNLFIEGYEANQTFLGYARLEKEGNDYYLTLVSVQ